MILVDANILLYAQDTLSTHHPKAHAWWEQQLSGPDPVCICWPVVSAFLRIGTNPRIFAKPLTIMQAAERVNEWFDQPCVRLVTPTAGHWELFRRLLEEGQATANLVSDAHIAALAIEHGCTLHSTDSDFARFRGLRWTNPLR